MEEWRSWFDGVLHDLISASGNISNLVRVYPGLKDSPTIQSIQDELERARLYFTVLSDAADDLKRLK